MQKEPSHRKIVILSLKPKIQRKKKQKPEKVVNFQSSADDVGQKVVSLKPCVDWNNESGILTLAPA